MKLFKNLKKGFTLIELVVVIAVIAILSAVSVVSYVSITNKAKNSNDENVLRQINMAIAARKTETEPATMSDALVALKEEGGISDVEKLLTATYKKNTFAYDQVNKEFVLLKEGEEPEGEKINYFKMVSSQEELTAANSEGYSCYLKEAYSGAVDTTKALDVGENFDVTSINYHTEENQSVILRTNGNMCVLTVNAKNSHVDHYGYAKESYVVAVNSSNSYHEHGTASELIVTSGKIVIEKTAVVFNLSATQSATAVVSSKGGNVMESSVQSVPASTSFEIYSLGQLEAFRDATNSGETFKDKVVNLNCDITLKEAWKPISNYYRKDKSNNKDTNKDGVINASDKDYYGDFDLSTVAFQGKFNGKGHTISGLTNIGLDQPSYNTGYNSTSPSGKTEAVYGFFALVLNAEIKDLKFANVKISSDAFGTLLGDSVGSLVGYVKGDTKISNIEVLSGSVEAYDSVGGIIGCCRNGIMTISGCKNNASVTACRRSAGIVAQFGSSISSGSSVTNCLNSGTISQRYDLDKTKTTGFSYYHTAGIAVLNGDTSSYFVNCSNSGAISSTLDMSLCKENTTNIGEIVIVQTGIEKK